MVTWQQNECETHSRASGMGSYHLTNNTSNAYSTVLTGSQIHHPGK